jgi:hypothetical protein
VLQLQKSAVLIFSSIFRVDLPAAIVIVLSIVIGLLMVLVFAWTSDQKAIHVAKDQLKAHLLAVRLFQDQLPVVLRSYGRILRGTGRYLRLAFKPLLFAIVPLTALIVFADLYLGWMPLKSGETFLVKVHTGSADALDGVSLQLPPEIESTAPAVHVPVDNEVIWRAAAAKEGKYEINVADSGQTVSKRVVVSDGISRLSPIRLQGFWKRMFISGEPALPDGGNIQSVEVVYPARNIYFLGIDWNWIWLFFVLSLIAGFAFKSILGIEI